MPIGPQYSEWGAHWGFDPSWYGIQLLFILSGFLAVRSMANGRSILAFFTSRLRSLWPGLICATLVTAFIIYPLLCAPDAPVRMTALDLVSYTLKTIFLIDPGQHKLRLNARRIIVSAAALAAATTAFYMWLPWSSVLEIMGVTVWLTICLGFLHNAPKVLQRCPRLSPVLYVCIWPAAQIMTALSPNSTQMSIIQLSLLLSISAGVLVFLLLRQARIQPARL